MSLSSTHPFWYFLTTSPNINIIMYIEFIKYFFLTPSTCELYLGYEFPKATLSRLKFLTKEFVLNT
mgnify:CR=1 FL=1|jgi:hypothetical protein